MITRQGFYGAVAWLRAAHEKRREFVSLPSDLLELDQIAAAGPDAFDAWIKTYTPGRLEAYEVPKGDGKSRPVFYTPMRDRMALLSALLSDYTPLRETVESLEPAPNHFATMPAELDQRPDWFTQFKDEYASFRMRTSELLATHDMVFTDIKNFAGSIHIDILQNDLVTMGVQKPRAALVCDTLSEWSRYGLRGVPQGSCLTDLLLKVYLHSLDRQMLTHPDVTYYRYNDDLRLASQNPACLRASYQSMISIFGGRGLQFNMDKTAFYTPAHAPVGARDALSIEDFLQPCWNGVRMTTPGLRAKPRNIRDHVYDALPPALLRSVYATHIAPMADGSVPNPPVTLFNFTIRRMGHAGVDIALCDTASLIQDRPERLSLILAYLLQMKTQGKDVMPILPGVEKTLNDPYSQYVYARFLVDLDAPRHLKSYARDIDTNAPVFLKRFLADALQATSLPVTAPLTFAGLKA